MAAGQLFAKRCQEALDELPERLFPEDAEGNLEIAVPRDRRELRAAAGAEGREPVRRLRRLDVGSNWATWTIYDPYCASPRFAVPFLKISRVSGFDHPVHPIWTDTYSQLIAPNNGSPTGAIRPKANIVAGASFAGPAGTSRRVGPRLRSNAASSRVALLALSVLAASLPGARALTACQAPLDTFANPFEKGSAHHRPIGSDAIFADTNDPSTISLLKANFGNINSNNGWGTNVYRSTAEDPLKTVTQAGTYDIGLSVTLRVPDGANNGNKSDSVVVIVEDGTGIAHQFYQWRWNNGEPTAGIHRQWDTNGLGHSQPGGPRVGTSASGVAGMFGLLRGHEVNTPGHKIEHALQITLSHGKDSRGKQLQNEVVWPAMSTDWYCESRPDLCAGEIPYGALLALPPSVSISSLGLSEPGGRLAQALQNYGAYVIDGSECPAIRGDQDINAEVLETLKQDMRKIYPLLRMILNNSAGQAASGGGMPRADNCAFDSSDR